MQLLKISFVLFLTISLCSFAFLTNVEDGKDQLYKDFLSEFEQVTFPNTVTLGKKKIQLQESKNLQKIEQKEITEVVVVDNNILGNDYATFIPGINRGKMSRMGPSTFQAEIMVASNDKFNAVIYSKSQSYRMSSKSFYIATYDKDGNQVDSKYLGYAGHDTFLKLTGTKKLALTIKEMINKNDANSTKKMFITTKGEILVHNNNDSKKTKTPTKKSKLTIG